MVQRGTPLIGPDNKMKKKDTATTREEWLTRALDEFRQWFRARSLTLPEKIRVSVGFPSTRALSNRNRAVGQCWSDSSKDGAVEIFVSPVLGDAARALDVLIHELCHAVAPKAGHKGDFRKAAKKMGLAGKMTATVASPELAARLNALLPSLGDYPHAELAPISGLKKQSTRLQKAVCAGCGYTIRVTQKWIDFGLPTCTPCGCLFEIQETEEG